MAYHFRNLVFEGGGVRGIAYAGALEVLEEEKILPDIKRVAGTSAGAILAVLVGLGYTPAEIENIVWNLDFNKFKDDSWGFLRDSKRIFTDYGWFKGDFFREFIGGIIKDKTGDSETTFGQLAQMKQDGKPFLDIYLIGSNLSTEFSEMFSSETTPDFSIADAARISMSIPIFFAAVRANPREDVYVDGGLLDNYPIQAFDNRKFVAKHFVKTKYYEKINEAQKKMPKGLGLANEYVYNQETLGFRLDSSEEISIFHDNTEPQVKDIDNLFDYTSALLRTLIDFQRNTHLHSDDWQRTIYIDTLDVKATDFDLSDEKKNALLESGRSYTKSYLEWFNNDEEKANKVK